MIKLNKDQIRELLPHREPMLLIDELVDIKKLHSAKAIIHVKKDAFFLDGHFPDNPVMPGVLIVEAFGQAAGLTLHIECLYGVNNHHKVESCFKGVARALRQAIEIDMRKANAVPSTKGVLGGSL